LVRRKRKALIGEPLMALPTPLAAAEGKVTLDPARTVARVDGGPRVSPPSRSCSATNALTPALGGREWQLTRLSRIPPEVPLPRRSLAHCAVSAAPFSGSLFRWMPRLPST